jgi:hypothetical protein
MITGVSGDAVSVFPLAPDGLAWLAFDAEIAELELIMSPANQSDRQNRV